MLVTTDNRPISLALDAIGMVEMTVHIQQNLHSHSWRKDANCQNLWDDNGR